jgi:hypothetical protein
MDGAGLYRLYFYVALPMVKNALLTVGLVQFFFCWNDLLLSYTFVTKTATRTIQTGLLSFVGQYGQREWGPHLSPSESDRYQRADERRLEGLSRVGGTASAPQGLSLPTGRGRRRRPSASRA